MNVIGIINLNLTVERIYPLPGFKPGAVHRAQTVTVQAGGKGMNVAAVLQTLGERAEVAGGIGGASGEMIRQDMAARGFKGKFFALQKGSRTCLVINDTAGGVQTVINEAGAAVTRKEAAALKGFVRDFIAGKSVAVFSGSVLPGITPADYRAMVRAAAARRIPTIVDISGPYLTAAIAERPTVIKPNREEWERAFGRKLPDTGAIARSVRPVLAEGVRWAVISLGAGGALFFKKEASWRVRVPKIAAVNAVGCGDALAAGIAKGLSAGWQDEEMIRFSSAVAAAHALTPLPGAVRLQDIKKLLPEIRVRKINA
jgi:tagatose 6-phosphate kinase